jgi:hypothetical protein
MVIPQDFLRHAPKIAIFGRYFPICPKNAGKLVFVGGCLRGEVRLLRGEGRLFRAEV